MQLVILCLAKSLTHHHFLAYKDNYNQAQELPWLFIPTLTGIIRQIVTSHHTSQLFVSPSLFGNIIPMAGTKSIQAYTKCFNAYVRSDKTKTPKIK